MRDDIPLVLISEMERNGRIPYLVAVFNFDVGKQYISDRVIEFSPGVFTQNIIADMGNMSFNTDPFGFYAGKILPTTSIRITVNNSGSNPFSLLFIDQPPANVSVDLYQCFEGFTERYKIDTFYCSDPIAWSQSSASLSIDLLSANQVNDPTLADFDQENGDFPDVDYRNGSFSYNPAYGIEQVLSRLGLQSVIEPISFQEASDWYEDNDYEFSNVIPGGTACRQVLIDMLYLCRSHLQYSAGFIKLNIFDKETAPVKTFTNDDIVAGNCHAEISPIANIVNNITYNFVGGTTEPLNIEYKNQESIDKYGIHQSLVDAYVLASRYHVVVEQSGDSYPLFSDDALTWTMGLSSIIDVVYIAYGKGVFVGAGYYFFAISNDGIQWSYTVTGLELIRDIIYSNGRFIAVGDKTTSGKVGIYISDDAGASWAEQGPPCPDFIVRLEGLCSGKKEGELVAVGRDLGGVSEYSGAISYYSTDNGTTWHIGSSMPPIYPKDVAFGNDVYVSVGDVGGFTLDRVAISTDGISWVPVPAAIDETFSSVAYGAGYFIAATASDRLYGGMRSVDGSSWEALASMPLSPEFSTQFIEYCAGYYIVTQRNQIGLQSIHISRIGDNWQAVGPENTIAYMPVNSGKTAQILAEFWLSRLSSPNIKISIEAYLSSSLIEMGDVVAVRIDWHGFEYFKGTVCSINQSFGSWIGNRINTVKLDIIGKFLDTKKIEIVDSVSVTDAGVDAFSLGYGAGGFGEGGFGQ